MMQMWQFERDAAIQGFQSIAGVDEAGRGPLAGPVVSAAVIFPARLELKDDLARITDSKKLTEKQRLKLFPVIQSTALCVATGIASHEEIDRINILQASLLSMKRAVDLLDKPPDCLLIDGKFTIDSPVHQRAVVKGDSKSVSIAAASIIAKVTRDAMMADFHRKYPEYGFIKHKGYPTKAHKAAILEHGPCPIHRLSFNGVKGIGQ